MTYLADGERHDQSLTAQQSGLAVTVAGTRGHVTLTADEDLVAVWQLSATGVRTGAWTCRRNHPEQARRALTLIERRAIAGTDRASDIAALRALLSTANVKAPDAYEEHWVDLRRALQEVADVRAELSQAVTAHGCSKGTSPAPLTYNLQLPAQALPMDTPGALQVLGMHLPSSPDRQPSVADALGKALLVSGMLRWWQDTEASRVRRAYLRPYGGPTTRPLPPKWLAHLEAAFLAPFAL